MKEFETREGREFFLNRMAENAGCSREHVDKACRTFAALHEAEVFDRRRERLLRQLKWLGKVMFWAGVAWVVVKLLQ